MKGKDLWDSEVEDVVQHLILNYFFYLEPWHVGAPGISRPPSTLKDISKRKERVKNAKEASNTIKSYGWYSGLCLVATVGQVWNS